MKLFKHIFSIFLIICVSLHTALAGKITQAGARSSIYGARDWPTNQEWGNIMLNMASFFGDDCEPVAIWIIGTIHSNRCQLEFPSPGGSYTNITFQNSDRHEEILDYFDQIGVKAYLQVESGDAEMLDLIDLIYQQYGHHKCVIGFGVDVEWYFYSQNNQGIAVTDEKAEAWDTRVKSHDSNDRIFLKHWLTSKMPSTYRSDIVFINDGQGSSSFDSYVRGKANWINHFAPNPAMIQGGYANDRDWWQDLTNPPKEIGDAIAAQVDSETQEVGWAWVDFTLRDDIIEPLLFQDHPTPIIHLAAQNTQKNAAVLRTELSAAGMLVRYVIPEQMRNAQLAVFSPNGAVITANTLDQSSGTIVLDMHGMASGMHLIQIRKGNTIITEKAPLVK